MRTLALLLLLSLPTLLTAQETQPAPEPEQPPVEGPEQPAPAITDVTEHDPLTPHKPLYIDAAFDWRTRRRGGWRNAEAMFRIPGSLFAPEDARLARLHKYGVLGRYESGFELRPRPERAMLLGVYTWGLEDPTAGLPGLGGGWFPMQRSSFAAFHFGLAAGWSHSVGTLDEPDRTASQDSLRFEHFGEFQLIVFGLRHHLAADFHLRHERALDFEAGIWITLGRPILPMGVAFGYVYMGTERAGGGMFSMRVSLHL